MTFHSWLLLYCVACINTFIPVLIWDAVTATNEHDNLTDFQFVVLGIFWPLTWTHVGAWLVMQATTALMTLFFGKRLASRRLKKE